MKIESLEKDWKVYPVFHLDFNGGDFTQKGVLEQWISDFISLWEDKYELKSNPNYPIGLRFLRLLEHVHNIHGCRAVVLVDEYDKPILDVLGVDKN